MSLDYLRYLARHEPTAARVCRKLAIRFVSDDPPASLVDELVRTYLSSGTDIKAVLRTLVASEIFWASAGQKVRNPVDDVVATVRALGVKVEGARPPASFAHELSTSIKSVRLFQWPRPDGPPDTADAWCSASRMLGLLAQPLGAGRRLLARRAGGLPQAGLLPAAGPDPLRPPRRPRLSRTVLGKPSTARLLQAACEGLDVAPGRS